MWAFYLFTSSVTMFFSAGLEDNPNYHDNCGLDFTDNSSVIEGEGRVEDYPWVGILLFPIGSAKATSVVVLVTRQMVIGSASEIDKLPKDHFRLMSRVILGTNSSGPHIRIREYTYHHEYGVQTSSSLALIQLDLDHVNLEVYPICGPPTHFYYVHIYAFSLNEDCQYPVLTIQEMTYVHEKECKRYYRRNGLDVGSMWPTRTTCARGLSGKECVWRGGAALAVKLGGRWHLLGFGVYGPGCSAPSRFIDYGAHVSWVKRSVERIGKPAVTRVGPGTVILRRTVSSLQRFGLCDVEEVLRELYTDTFRVVESDKLHKRQQVKYNVSLSDELEYSCVIFEVFANMKYTPPFLRLKRWCAQPTGLCYGFQFIKVEFYVEIDYVPPMTFKMQAYGRAPITIDVKRAMKYYNSRKEKTILLADSKWKEYVEAAKKLFWLNIPINKTAEEIKKKAHMKQMQMEGHPMPPKKQLKMLREMGSKKLRATLNDSPLDGYESFYFDMYKVNIKNIYNKNQHIFNESFAQTLWGDERRQYYRYLGLHSTYNPDAYQHTNSSDGGGVSDLDYTEYLSLEKKFGTKSSQTVRITTRTKTELRTKPITTTGTINNSTLNGYELFHFDTYNVNIKKDYNKNQRIYNESIAQTLWDDERRQYYRYLGLHSIYNPDAYQHTDSSYGGVGDPDYTEYLSLEKKFGTKSSQTLRIPTRTTTELQIESITTRGTINDSPLDGYELFYFDMYNVYIKKDYNKNQRIYNESIAQTLWDDERRQYYRYLGLHSIYNPDAYQHTTSAYGGVVDPDYTEYLSLEKKFGTKSSKTERITRTTTELQTEPTSTRGTINYSPLDDNELLYFDMYNKNMEKKHNKNQRIYNKSIAQTYWDDERRQYYRYLGLHSLFNRDAGVHTYNEYGEVLRPNYTEYLSLEKRFGMKSSQTEPISTRNRTELQTELTTRGTRNDSPLDGDEIFYFDMYNKNMEKKHNKNQRIYNESIAQTYWDDERRQYYRYLGLHSLFNRDASVYTYKEYGELLRPNYTEYLSLEKRFGMKSSQTEPISSRTRTELPTEPITTRGTQNDSPLNSDELFYFNMYNKNMEKKHNKNQRIYNKSIAQTYRADKRRQYYSYLGLHSLFNRDAGVHTYNEYGEVLRPNYTEYLSLEKEFGMKSSQTEPISTRNGTELQTELITTRGTTNDSPLDGDELFYFDMYNKNMEKKHNKNQRIYNEGIAQTYSDDERRQYYRYLGLHSLFNRDAVIHTYNEYGDVLRPNYTEYLSLEEKFGTKSSQTEPITIRTTTELQTEPITTRGTTNVSP